MLRRVIDEDVELRVVLQRGLHPVLVDRAQLEQLIMSLALNARDAMPRGGTLTFKTAVLDLGAAEAPRHPGVAPGPWVLLEVSDTGQGMDAETLAHAFEPFFTTKGRDQGAGAGLGLATVYGIVKQAGGHVTAESEPGRGARFRIYLPRLRGEHEGAPVTAEAPAEPGGQQTILLIEDEPALRELLREVLAEAGYRVFAVGDGEAGLAAAREHREALHLLLTDVVMPRMSGREVAARLRLERPGLRVLYMSGYTDNAIFQHGLPEPGATFLQKPIGPETLVRRVRELLGR
jgi:CheY-like chemotaxis protein